MLSRAVAEFHTKVRVRVEALAILAKNSTTFLGLLYDSSLGNQSRQYSLVAFAFGQLAYGIVKLGTYTYYYGRPTILLKPTKCVNCVFSRL
jgi:oligosaccharide translocation protein RFT1